MFDVQRSPTPTAPLHAGFFRNLLRKGGGWDASEHPQVPKGTHLGNEHGGEFAPKGAPGVPGGSSIPRAGEHAQFAPPSGEPGESNPDKFGHPPAPGTSPWMSTPSKGEVLSAADLLHQLQPHITTCRNVLPELDAKIAHIEVRLQHGQLGSLESATFRRHLSALRRQRFQVRQSVISASRAILQLPASMRGRLHVEGTVPSGIQHAATAGRSVVEQYVHRDLLHRPEVRFVPLPPGHRSWHDNGTVHLPPDASPAKSAHEIVHAIEKQNPSVLAKSRAFLAHRAAGYAAVRLDELHPDQHYKPWEKTFEDEWVRFGGHAYSGKFYPPDAPVAHATGTELLTMGIERLHSNPALFAATDPEYFHFVANTLRNL